MILQCVGQVNWFHVDTHKNPADLATRGVSHQDLVGNDLWWNGPDFISKDPSQWPYSNSEDPCDTEVEKNRSKFISPFSRTLKIFLIGFPSCQERFVSYRMSTDSSIERLLNSDHQTIPFTKGEIHFGRKN